MIRELRRLGIVSSLVLADSLYGENSEFLEVLGELNLHFVVAMRSNHGVWLGLGQWIRYTRWRPFERIFSGGERETHSISEVIYGQRRRIRYYQTTTDPHELPPESTWFVMTNLEGSIQKEVGNRDGLSTWIEYGCKQIKDELGWAGFRVTSYPEIEKWWEIVTSAYLMVSFQATVFQAPQGTGEWRSKRVYTGQLLPDPRALPPQVPSQQGECKEPFTSHITSGGIPEGGGRIG